MLTCNNASKHLLRVSRVIAIFALSISHAFAVNNRPVNWVFDANPLSIINSPDLDGFNIRTGFSYEEIDGSISLAPNIKTGVNFYTPVADLDLLVGVGSIINGAFSGGFITAEVAAMFRAGSDHFAIGPHFGVISLADTEWDEDNFSEVDLEGNSGVFGGLAFHLGGGIVDFKANLDFVDVKYDVINFNPSQIVSGNVLDMSGFWLNLGVHLKL